MNTGMANGNGQGTGTHPNGDIYVGEWKDGKKHGQGTENYGNGDKYVGEWKDGHPHGQGTGTHPDGVKYVGEYRNGHPHGWGTATHPNGNKYVGESINGQMHGQGSQTFANGRVREGIWDDGKFVYAQKVTPPPVIARRKPPSTPRRRSDPDKVVSASSGTGFAVSSRGHVITNHHVIEGCQNVKIHHNGKSIPATVVTFDPGNDLALLKGDFRPSTVFPLSTNSPELLQDIYVAGYPFGRKTQRIRQSHEGHYQFPHRRRKQLLPHPD